MSKLQELGLKKLYTLNPELARTIKCCMALPFVPLSRIDEGFQIAKDYAKLLHANFYDRTMEFLQYFENTWLLGSYSPLTWNFYASYNQRTNNVSEGYNHLFNSCREFGGVTAHPNIFLLIDVVKKELLRTQERALMFEIGQDPRTRKGSLDKAKQKQQQRHKLMLKLSNGQIQLPDYMEAVGRSSLLTHYERAEEQVKNSAQEDSEDEFEDVQNTPENVEKEKSAGKKSDQKKSSTKKSGEKTSNTKSDKQNSTGKSKSKGSTGKKSDTNDSSNKKSDQGSQRKNSNSSGQKPPATTLFAPSPSPRTPKRHYLTGEAKGKFNFIQIMYLIWSICFKSCN